VILVAGFAIAALSVVACGGSLAGLAGLRVRAWWAVGAALALQIVIISLIPKEVVGESGQALQLVSYGLAAVFLLANLRVPWLWLIGLGGLSNLAAISANGGVMPASPVALRAAGIAHHAHKFFNSTTVPHARLTVLGDDFSLPRTWPLANVFSIGDIILVAGALLLLHTVGESWPARRCSQWRWLPTGNKQAPAHSSRYHRRMPGLQAFR
jgi:hypothetical protein